MIGIFSTYFQKIRQLLPCFVLFVCLQSLAQTDASYLLRNHHVVALSEANDSECSSDLLNGICKGLFGQIPCEICLPCVGDTMPNYYCDCLDGIDFKYGLDILVSDTIWYVAKVSDILDGGISAYWFSDYEVTIDLYIMCSLFVPNKSLSLTKNTSKILSVAEIKSILGTSADLGDLIGFKPVYIRVAPSGVGRVMINKYGEHFPSECGEDISSLYYGIDYAVSDEQMALSLAKEEIKNLKFVNWVQNKNKPVTMTFRAGDCQTGKVLSEITLSDSIRPYVPTREFIDELYQTQESIYINLKAEDFGKIHFHNKMFFPNKYKTERDTSICYGSEYKDNFIVFNDTTIADTTWAEGNNMAITKLNIKVISPDPTIDTLIYKYKDLPFIYHGQVIRDFGTYDVIEMNDGGCASSYQLTVLQDLITTYEEDIQTVCKGKHLEVAGIVYTSDTMFVDTVIVKAKDLRTITTHIFVFELPVMEYDTIYFYETELERGHRYSGTYYVESFGDTIFYMTKEDNCDRMVQVTAYELFLPMDYKDVEIDTVLCVGKGLLINYLDTMVYQQGTYKDSVLISKNEMLCITYNLTLEQTEPVRDTILVKQRALPYLYQDTLLSEYGDHEILVAPKDDCHYLVYLNMLPEVEYIINEIDTILCSNLAAQLQNDTIQYDDYIYGVTIYNITISDSEPEQLTISAKESELPIEVEGVRYLEYGSYHIELLDEIGCTRIIDFELLPVEDHQSKEETLTICHGKSIELDGVRYYENTDVVKEEQLSQYTWMQTTYHLVFDTPKEMLYDTLVVTAAEFPIMYADAQINDFGVYQLLLVAEEECDVLLTLAVLQATAVNNIHHNGLRVVPSVTKASNILHVTTQDDGVLQVLDILGRVVREQKVKAGIVPLQLNEPGNYIIQLKTFDAVSNCRVIIN